MEIVYRPLAELHPNPKNPRKVTQDAVAALAESIKANPQFFEARPILLSDRTGKLVIIGGERRSEAARLLEMTEVPTILMSGLTEAQEDEIMVRDNTHAGVWDDSKLTEIAAKWGEAKVHSWTPGVSWGNRASGWDGTGTLSSKDGEGDEEYNEFIDKFKIKLTTDDCYTPEPVYEAVRTFVNEKLCSLEGRQICRPFYPGGDYKNFEYAKDAIVIDNPPFSILSEIVRWYSSKNVKFFLFTPALTGWVAKDVEGLTYITMGGYIIYENGARVRTSFITNLCPEVRIIISHVLYKMIEDAQPQEKANLPKFKMPPEVITAARIMKYADTFDFEIKASEIEDVVSYLIEKETKQKKEVFGGGIL